MYNRATSLRSSSHDGMQHSGHATVSMVYKVSAVALAICVHASHLVMIFSKV